MKKNFIRHFSSFLFSYKVERRKSEMSGMIEVLYTNGKYVLDAPHVNYSFGGLHTVFQKAFNRTGIRRRKINKTLILGFGSGSVASILQDEYGKDIDITGVEKDEAVIELAKKYFSIDKYRKLSLHCQDAYDFVQRCSADSMPPRSMPPRGMPPRAVHSDNSTFDLIVMDVFIGLEVPEKFLEEKYISLVGNLLSDKGILFFNLVVHNEKARDKGAELFTKMNSLIGKTEWLRIFVKRTENWVFVCDKRKTP